MKKDWMIFDRLMPEFQVHQHHRVLINAPVEQVYQAVYEVDFKDCRAIHYLFALRGLPTQRMELKHLQEMFPVLHEVPGEEIIMGGKEKLHGGTIHIIWNFKLVDLEDRTILTTETRVHLDTWWGLALFRVYWLFISPFSRWIRSMMLHHIKVHSENPTR